MRGDSPLKRGQPSQEGTALSRGDSPLMRGDSPLKRGQPSQEGTALSRGDSPLMRGDSPLKRGQPSQEGTALSRGDMQPFSIGDLYKGSALLCDIDGKPYLFNLLHLMV